jgi:uncharacterized protein (TIGR00297 family)
MSPERNREHQENVSKISNHKITAQEASNPDAPAPNTRSLSLADTLGLVAAALLLLASLALQGAGPHLYAALAITLAFALVARAAHGVDTSGMMAGAAVAFIFASRDLRLFWTLLAVFVVTLAATRVGHHRKQHLRIAERAPGRSASQVMANLAMAGLLLAFPSLHYASLLALAALAELAADTASSELGTALPGKTVLITTFKPVTPGIDGGVSLGGTLAGISAAILIAACAMLLHLATLQQMFVIVGAGTAGMLADSLIGALLERNGYLNNDTVNLLGTMVASGVAWAVLR